MHTLFKESQQNSEIKNFRDVILQKLKVIVHKKYKDVEISLYGSCVSGFETKSSDVDVSINYKQDPDKEV